MKPKITYFILSILLLIPHEIHAQFSGNPHTGGFSDSLASFLESFLGWILAAILIFSILGLPISVILYISSGGADDRLAEGRNVFKYSLLGIILSSAGFFLLRYLASSLSV